MADRVLTLDGLRLHASQNEVRMKVRRKEQLGSLSESQLQETQLRIAEEN